MTSNVQRARWAEQCLHMFIQLTGVDCMEDAIGDLIANLGHLSDEAGFDFFRLVATGIGHWHLELSNEESIDALPRVEIHIGDVRKLVS